MTAQVGRLEGLERKVKGGEPRRTAGGVAYQFETDGNRWYAEAERRGKMAVRQRNFRTKWEPDDILFFGCRGWRVCQEKILW
jgi:hypothetical protein